MNDVTTLQLLLWVVYPYMVLAVFVLGHVWRFKADRFGWTSRSSQIYESRLLSIGSPMFHYGIIGIFVGHVVGLGIPKSWTRFFGISDHMYHLMAVTIGLAAAAACVGGLLILIYRRRTNTRVFGATTAGDKLMYLLLALAIAFGVLATLVHTTFGAYDYREGVSIWFRNFWTLRPDPTLMSQAPIFFQLHVLSALTLFATWPFTRLVHVFAAPVGYLTRPYIVYRSKDPRKEAERRGWEKVKF
ncbi:respiratory nitrate reductase subunit gamma [Brachybacterium alimentarium]|uniref:respiratory nitrate reductase subunit gamma n=1 Tax=Brachybacterium alimentarium TaxID=47845 RepID=UPI003FB92296